MVEFETFSDSNIVNSFDIYSTVAFLNSFGFSIELMKVKRRAVEVVAENIHEGLKKETRMPKHL